MALNKRMVIVGMGSIGKRHARLLTKRLDISIELCDSNPQTLHETIKVTGDLPLHYSFNQMLATKPDMVLIATPHNLHAEQTIRALNSGAHVLCEKPMSNRLDTARAVLKTAVHTNQIPYCLSHAQTTEIVLDGSVQKPIITSKYFI